MRKDLYEDLCEVLSMIEEVKHIDLWNHNVEFLEQEDVWERPAVFIEFTPIRWESIVENGAVFKGEGMIRLHIVTDWKGNAAKLDVFSLCESIHNAMQGLTGEKYGAVQLSESHTNHNHEDLVESIEVYSFQCEKTLC